MRKERRREMTLSRHAFRGVSDLERVVDLIRAAPTSARHVVDYSWRLCSPAIAEGKDAAWWEDADGRVVALAAWQYYWATLDFYILPNLATADATAVERDLFAWAGARFRERDVERGWPLPYAMECREGDLTRLRLAEAHGFLSGDDEDGYVLLQRDLTALAPVPAPPEGFTMRPLAGAGEAAAYAALHRAAFNSDSMTADWRERTLRAPLYRPDLDLVIQAADGALAAFCVGWYEPARGVAQIEPAGVHPRYQRLGLARALLLEMLRRFALAGATLATVETNRGRAPARQAYTSAGFTETGVVRRVEAMATEVV